MLCISSNRKGTLVWRRWRCITFVRRCRWWWIPMIGRVPAAGMICSPIHQRRSGYLPGRSAICCVALTQSPLPVAHSRRWCGAWASRLSASSTSPTASDLQPSTFNLQPSTFNLQPSTLNLPPSHFASVVNIYARAIPSRVACLIKRLPSASIRSTSSRV